MELPLTVMFKGQTGETRGNRLLTAMEADSRARIEPHLEPVVLELGEVVCDAGGLLKHAYFPRGAVLSLLTVLENGSAVETANIGREGAFGLFAAMYSLGLLQSMPRAIRGWHCSMPDRTVTIGVQP
jgi:hypothetical protein